MKAPGRRAHCFASSAADRQRKGCQNTKKINGQKIWFSSDLRIFNYNKRGERFLYFVDGVPQLVNLKQVLGVDDEAGSAAPTADDGEQAKTLQTVCPQAPADDAD